MGKSKPNELEKIVSAKTTQKAKELAEKIQERAAAGTNLNALDDFVNKEASKIDILSKKIQKEPIAVNKSAQSKEKKKKQPLKKERTPKKPKFQVATEEIRKNKFETLDVNKYDAFIKTQNTKYMRIRKRTIQLLKVDKNQVKKAAQSLIQNFMVSLKKNQLSGHPDEFIYLEIALTEGHQEFMVKPIQVKLPEPIYGPGFRSKFCVISRDPPKEFKDKIQDLEISNLGKVVGLSSLTKELTQATDKRKVVDSFDLFFSDYRIYNLLKKPPTNIFYQRNKIPFPIDCVNTPSSLKDQFKTYEDYLNHLCDFTYFSPNSGAKSLIRVARVSMELKSIVKNIIHAVYNTVPHILKQSLKHTRIKQISIKTSQSISLPIYDCPTEEELDLLLQTEENDGIETEGADEIIN